MAQSATNCRCPKHERMNPRNATHRIQSAMRHFVMGVECLNGTLRERQIGGKNVHEQKKETSTPQAPTQQQEPPHSEEVQDPTGEWART